MLHNPVSPDPAGPGLLATPTSTPIHGTHPMAHYLQATPHGPSISPFTSTMPDGIDAALSGLAPPPPPPPPKSVLDRAFTASSSSPPTSSPLRRSSMTPSSSGGINSDESKGSLLSSSPPSPAQAQNPALAAVTASTKGSRRSSKLFGKLVPKFLQTSFHPNSGPVAGGSSSPRSAVPVSPSPLSSVARPTRSASFTAGTGSEIGAAVVAAGAASGSAGFGSGNKGPLPQLPELPDLSTSVLSSSEDWLGLNGGASHNSKENKDNNKAPSPVLSASPITMESDRPSVVSASTAQFNMSIVAVEESVEGSIHSTDSAFDRRSFNSLQEHDRPLSTMPQEDLYFQKQGHHHSQLQYQYNYHYNDDDEHNKENDEDHLAESPYIIDENCDDNFFLNSVLRKKNSTTSTSNSNNGHSTASSPRPQPPPLLSTGSWNHGATPSLSATSSSSHSQASSMAPSPTSPYPSSSMYTSIPTPVSTTTATPLPLSYRSSYSSNGSTIGGNATTTQMIQSGLDEKRSRLRDAVGEWRRSANASLNSNESTSPPVSTSYSGFAL
ncbi:hypothetical protein BGW39_007479 [Mortierella sp. 14UC]|nr:hypothetical protein BGW39_007479 [Mortierella sp. 14UC]